MNSELIMKKKVILIVLLLISFSGLSAQIRLGVLGGMNIASVKQKNILGPDLKSRVKYTLGGLIEYSPFKNLSLVAEPMYIEKGTKSEITFISMPGLKMNFDSDYFEIPILLKYSVGERIRPYLLAGATYGFNLNSSAEINLGIIDFEFGMGDLMNTSEFSFTFGAGISYQVDELMFLQLEAKYCFGLNNMIHAGRTRIGIFDKYEVLEIPGNVDYSNRGFQLLLGLSLPLVLE
jgi:hypothetical protein